MDIPADTASAEIALRFVENQSILGGQPLFDARLSPAMKPIYILGDHHGDYETVFSAPKERGIRDATVIHVGDGTEGFPGWPTTSDMRLNRDFSSLGIEYLSIRGN